MKRRCVALPGVVLLFLAGCGTPPGEVDEGGGVQAHDADQSTRAAWQFIDGPEVGLAFVHRAGFSTDYSIYEPLGGGVAVLDCDGDGDLDVYLPQYASGEAASQLLRNDALRFTDVTADSGLGSRFGEVFAAVGDVNNDGMPDLLSGGENRLFLWLGQGGCRFSVDTSVQVPAGRQFYVGASFADFNGDGWLDFWAVNYVDDAKTQACRLPNGVLDYCPPKAHRFLPDGLWLNRGDGRFAAQDISTLLSEPLPGLGAVAADFDGDGWPDLYVANDGENNALLMNVNGVLQADSAARRGAAVNLMGEAEASMGVAVGDVNGDARMDLFMTHFSGESNTLYINQGGHFMDLTMQSSLVAAARPMTGFGTVFADFDGDGLLDIAVANGATQIDLEVSGAGPGQQQLRGEPVQFWRNQGALRFAHDKNASNTAPLRVGRGLAAGDLDNDGDVDLLVGNNNQPVSVLLNESNPSNWLGVSLMCRNRHDVGALLRVRFKGETEQMWQRHVHRDGSYASSSDPRILIPRANEMVEWGVRWSHAPEYQVLSLPKSSNQYMRIDCPK